MRYTGQIKEEVFLADNSVVFLSAMSHVYQLITGSAVNRCCRIFLKYDFNLRSEEVLRLGIEADIGTGDQAFSHNTHISTNSISLESICVDHFFLVIGNCATHPIHFNE